MRKTTKAKGKPKSAGKSPAKRTVKAAARAVPKRTTKAKTEKRAAPKRKRTLIQKIINPFG